MPHRYVNSRAILDYTGRGDFSAFTYTQPIKADTRFSDPREMQG